ncbi:hypothetical protein Celaphus_00013049 [Cervus elaphus hippelaphus]|uniref:Uncharacterized protein n=1 Tax=Cervus elaphus hippelaphus TaxID=46360 RepID=A0A212CJ87_CEREH|nr:hypothetical protein Celaphus_00013049 [Cervus elaphus hippelaphus]
MSAFLATWYMNEIGLLEVDLSYESSFWYFMSQVSAEKGEEVLGEIVSCGQYWGQEYWDLESWDQEYWDLEYWDQEYWDQEYWGQESWGQEYWDQESWGQESWDL